MSIHLVGFAPPAQIGVVPGTSFDATADVLARAPVDGLRGEARLLGARLACQKGGPSLTGNDCLMCTHFRDWREGPGPEQVTIRCHWSHLSPVWSRMTHARALVAISPDLTCSAADRLAEQNRIRHLLITVDDQLVGVACRCDLVFTPADPLAAHMTEEVFAVAPSSSLGEAVSAMATLRVGFLPVIAGGLLVGVITRGDLRRANVPEELLGAGVCSACSSRHGVRKDRRLGIDYCLDCLKLEDLDADEELGQGD